MTQDQLTHGNKVSNRTNFYTHVEKVLKATGAANIDFTPLRDDLEELEVLRDMLLKTFLDRREAATEEFNKL